MASLQACKSNGIDFALQSPTMMPEVEGDLQAFMERATQPANGPLMSGNDDLAAQSSEAVDVGEGELPQSGAAGASAALANAAASDDGVLVTVQLRPLSPKQAPPVAGAAVTVVAAAGAKEISSPLTAVEASRAKPMSRGGTLHSVLRADDISLEPHDKLLGTKESLPSRRQLLDIIDSLEGGAFGYEEQMQMLLGLLNTCLAFKEPVGDVLALAALRLACVLGRWKVVDSLCRLMDDEMQTWPHDSEVELIAVRMARLAVSGDLRALRTLRVRLPSHVSETHLFPERFFKIIHMLCMCSIPLM